MNLYEVLKGIAAQSTVADREVASLSCDSRQVQEGSVFFCVPGSRSDGHDHAPDALRRGAAAVVCQRDLGLERQIIVEDTRQALGECCNNFFGRPASKLKMMAVTGTNGKTTVTYLIKHILSKAGFKVGLIGTIHNEIDTLTLPSRYTTPDPVALYAMLARMVEQGCTHVVMEVSSHALDQQRVAGCRFTTAAFTNLSQDHLDYHGDMERYFDAKRKLFSLCDTAILNLDDDYGVRLSQELDCPLVTYSRKLNTADYTAHDVNFSISGSRFVLMAHDKLQRVKLPTPGQFSVENALAAIASCVSVGVELGAVAQALSDCPGVVGRVEVLPTDTPYTVIRDYAHSPDSLQKILQTVREFAPARVVCLFGCAGNRDRAKRPIMAEIAARLSDFCILTSDNPRDEDPMRIIEDALPGLKRHSTPYMVIADRYDAIKWALENSRDDDVLILAGKGHEDYQVLPYGTIVFDEKQIVLSLLEKM